MEGLLGNALPKNLTSSLILLYKDISKSWTRQGPCSPTVQEKDGAVAVGLSQQYGQFYQIYVTFPW